MAAVIGNASGDAQPATSSVYENALQRAREIAAKITPDVPGPGPMGDFSQKRPLEDAEPGAKKLASAQIDPSLGNQMSMNNSVRTEPFGLPDRYVGLIIGKGGETITRLQSETGCRVQIAPESPAGSDERPCTLTGTPQQISACTNMLTEILGNAGQNNMTPMAGNGTITTIDVMIPPDKCGIVIGKEGQTIKRLKQQLQVQMNLIQENTQNTGQQKPLRITGDPDRVEQAKQAVEKLMQQRDEQMMYGGGGGGGGGGLGGGMGQTRRYDNQQGGDTMAIQVPRPAVGVVIGKSGDMISRIQSETGTRIQFKDDNPALPNRLCNITGTPDGCKKAQVRVEELIQSVQEHDASGVNTRRRATGSTFGQWEPGMGGGQTTCVEFQVPANKTGLVIGKRGENIRLINQQSGAHCEIQRNPPAGSDSQFKTFTIKGTQDQINHAQHLIQERVDGGPGGSGMQQGYTPPVQNNYQQAPPPGVSAYPPTGAPPQGGQYGSAQPNWNQYQQWTQPAQQNGSANPNDATQKAQSAAWAYYQQQQVYNQQPGATYPQQVAQGMPQMAGAAGAPGTSDYTKAWEEYFKKQAEQTASASAVPPTAGTPQPATSQAAAGGNVDYAAAWADYYRQYNNYFQQHTAGQYGGAASGQPQQ